MDVKEFVEATLMSVIEGVIAAQEAAAQLGAAVNPSLPTVAKDANGTTLGFTAGGALVTKVQFDIAVTAKDQTDAKGGGGVQVAGLFNVGGAASKSVASESVSRIQFFIPLALPVDDATKDAQAAQKRQQDAAMRSRPNQAITRSPI